MKKYWLFVWDPYEAEGGMNDFHSSADDYKELAETIKVIIKKYGIHSKYGHIFDSKSHKIIYKF